jgi:hypothetical protein
VDILKLYELWHVLVVDDSKQVGNLVHDMAFQWLQTWYVGELDHLLYYLINYNNDGDDDWLVDNNNKVVAVVELLMMTIAVMIEQLQLLLDQKKNDVYLLFNGLDF